MRNKRTLISGLMLALMVPFLAFSLVIAQTTETEEPENSREERRAQMQAAQEERMEQNAAQRRQQRIKTMQTIMGNQIRRAENALGRLEQIIERIEVRMDKLELDGADVAEAEELLAAAMDHKESAQEAIEKAKTDLAAITTSENPQLSVRAFMASMKELKKNLIDLHRSLKAVVKEMRTAAAAIIEEDEESGEEEEESNN